MCLSCIDGLVAMCLRNRSRSSTPYMHRQHCLTYSVGVVYNIFSLAELNVTLPLCAEE